MSTRFASDPAIDSVTSLRDRAARDAAQGTGQRTRRMMRVVANAEKARIQAAREALGSL